MLTHINPIHLDTVWPDVAPLLAEAIAKNHGEATLDQVRMQIAYGSAELLVHEQDATSIAVVEFKQHPNYRVAHVSYMAGAASEDFWLAFKRWAAASGASQVECLCGPGEERLFARYGMETAYRLMRASL